MPSAPHQAQIAGTAWSPSQYLKFADHRLRPALELLSRVPVEDPRVIYDLGCGPGHITRVIAQQFPHARVYGLDNSPDMLTEAAAEPSTIEWIEGAVETWSPSQPADLIYSNATLHWVPGNAGLFPRLLGSLKPGGCLAVQMPLSWGLDSHRLMRETLASGGPGGSALGAADLRAAVARKWVDDSEAYYDLLVDKTARLDIWEAEYLQVLEGDDLVFEWVKGTGLRPVLGALEDGERETFIAEYKKRLRVAYPVRSNGRTVCSFRRLFIVATT